MSAPEQTQPLTQLKPDFDGREMTIGGIITNVRTIITKSGTKMAFVSLEDKFGEGEVVIFPNLFEQVGAKLVQDAVIRVTGKNSARDRDGNLGSESKMIANEIVVIDDKEINSYESTGRKMEGPKVASSVKRERKVQYNTKRSNSSSANLKVKTAKNQQKNTHTSFTPDVVKPLTIKKLYVQIKNPDDSESLMVLKKACQEHRLREPRHPPFALAYFFFLDIINILAENVLINFSSSLLLLYNFFLAAVRRHWLVPSLGRIR